MFHDGSGSAEAARGEETRFGGADLTTYGGAAPAAVAAPETALPERIALRGNLTIGRIPAPGQVVLDHPTISRRHAGFESAEGGIVLRDLGSTNGTFVNGVRLTGGAGWRRGTASISARSSLPSMAPP